MPCDRVPTEANSGLGKVPAKPGQWAGLGHGLGGCGRAQSQAAGIPPASHGASTGGPSHTGLPLS